MIVKLMPSLEHNLTRRPAFLFELIKWACRFLTDWYPLEAPNVMAQRLQGWKFNI